MEVKLEVIKLENNNVISTSCNRETHYALTKVEIEGGPVIHLHLKINMAPPDYKYVESILVADSFPDGQLSEINKTTNLKYGDYSSKKITNLYYFEDGHYHLCNGEHYIQWN